MPGAHRCLEERAKMAMRQDFEQIGGQKISKGVTAGSMGKKERHKLVPGQVLLKQGSPTPGARDLYCSVAC